MSSDFKFSPAEFIPFRDTEVIERVRRIKREGITKHPNPDVHITVMPAGDIEFMWLTDMFYRIKSARDEGRRCVLIIPQPYTRYALLAHLINLFRVNCDHLHTFNMDEYANEKGEIAPETWRWGFQYSAVNNLYLKIDEDLRPPKEQIKGLTDDNIDDYGKMIADLGGADCCYSGPGWTGHIAFVEPDAPEFAGSLEEWKQMGPRVCTLNPLTVAQISLHGSFGMSGDLAAVPPKAATIGPAQVIAAKHRIDMNALTIDGSDATWQRLITRLCIHGPVTPKLPTSILQTLRTDYWISEAIAQDIEPLWHKGY